MCICIIIYNIIIYTQTPNVNTIHKLKPTQTHKRTGFQYLKHQPNVKHPNAHRYLSNQIPFPNTHLNHPLR